MIQKNLPTLLKVFAAYLSIVFLPVAAMQTLYIFSVDDWRFGLGTDGAIRPVLTAGLCLLFLQHLHRVFTIVTLFAKAPFAVLNARIYLITAFMVWVGCLLSIFVFFPQPPGGLHSLTNEARARVIEASIIVGMGLFLTLPWLILLSASKKVRTFAKL